MDYKPQIPSQYDKEQIILSSGRILFNAKLDSVMFFAKKSIALSSAGTINLDSDSHTIVNSPKIYLGLQAHKEKEPLLLGNKTNELLKDLLLSIKEFTNLIKTGGGTPQSLMAASGYLEGKANVIENVLKNKELLSKQNFTI